MSTNQTALGKAEFAAIDLLVSLPDKTAKVGSRASAPKGIIARPIAERLVAAGKAVMPDGKSIVHISVWDGDPEAAPQEGEVTTPEEPTPDEAKPPLTGQDLLDAQERVAAEKKAAKGKGGKTNGRKAKADASPYSTAPVAGLQKRHGKSRRTGTETEILDLLHPKSPTNGKVKGSGRYRVTCLTHGKSQEVPDMTTAKPLQARTDQFCPQCVKAVQERSTTQATSTTDAA